MSGEAGFDRAFPEVARREADHDLVNRFSYHRPTPEMTPAFENIRGMGLAMAREMNAYCPPSRELSLAFTAIETAVMWANASIARHGGGS